MVTSTSLTDVGMSRVESPAAPDPEGLRNIRRGAETHLESLLSHPWHLSIRVRGDSAEPKAFVN